VSEPLLEKACAKINLTLRVFGRREDGYHELESLVAFADLADKLELEPARATALEISGPFAAACGPVADNLVLKAAAALAARVGALQSGRFLLEKTLPVAAGIGGGSADAAAALRLLARLNGLAPDDPRLAAAALATGADVPVCLDSRSRIMRGVGDLLSEPFALPSLPALLVNPGTPLATRHRLSVRLRERSHAGCHRLRAGHHRSADGAAGPVGRAAGPHVGLGADLLCPVSLAGRGASRRAQPRHRTQGLVGAGHHDPLKAAIRVNCWRRGRFGVNCGRRRRR